MTDSKVILVTGASSGLGRACAERLLHDGYRLVVIGRNELALRSLPGLSQDDVIVADLTEPTAAKMITDRLKTLQLSLAGCVMAAGVHSLRPVQMESFIGISKPWVANVQGTLALLAGLVKARLFVRGASVVLFSSAAARTGAPAAVAYAASKGAIEAATFSLATELAPLGVRVNAIAPGLIRTPMSEEFLTKFTSEQTANLDARHILGPGTPADVSGPVAFLLSSDARWITGTILPVDGGFSIS